jgi:hypothetical protein
MASRLRESDSPFVAKRPAHWWGWYRGARSNAKWRKVCEARTEAGCWVLLTDYKNHRNGRAINCEMAALKAGVEPPTITR